VFQGLQAQGFQKVLKKEVSKACVAKSTCSLSENPGAKMPKNIDEKCSNV